MAKSDKEYFFYGGSLDGQSLVLGQGVMEIIQETITPWPNHLAHYDNSKNGTVVWDTNRIREIYRRYRFFFGGIGNSFIEVFVSNDDDLDQLEEISEFFAVLSSLYITFY